MFVECAQFSFHSCCGATFRGYVQLKWREMNASDKKSNTKEGKEGNEAFMKLRFQNYNPRTEDLKKCKLQKKRVAIPAD